MLNNDYDIRTLILITVLAFLIIVFFVRKSSEWHEKIVIIFLLAGTTVYSGIGISMHAVDNSYIHTFLVFIICEGIGMALGHKLLKKNNDKRSDSISIIANSTKIINVLAFMYWAILMFLIVYPTNHIGDLFSVKLDITGVIESRIAKRENAIVYGLGLIEKILSPFYCVYLSKRKKGIILFLLFLETYVNTVIDGYIGRTALMMLLVELIFVFVLIRGEEEKTSRFKFNWRQHWLSNLEKKETDVNQRNITRVRKALVIIGIISICAIPLLVRYQYTRHGQTYVGSDFANSFTILFNSEIYYPKHYSLCEEVVGQIISPLEYLYWFVTLPIPKGVFSLPSAITITYAFSTEITGISFGNKGFTVLLPSLLGEGILLWGKNFSFIHALFIGLVWGSINSFLKKYDGLFVFHILFITRTLNMVRGGTQGSMATIINGIVPFMIICWIMNSSAKKYKSKE